MVFLKNQLKLKVMKENQPKNHLSELSAIDSHADETQIDKNFVEIIPVFAQLYKQFESQNIHLQQITEELEQSRNDFKSLFDNAPFAYVVINRQGLVKSCNIAALNLVGCNKPDKAEKELFRTLILPEKRAEFDAFIQNLLKTTVPDHLPSVLRNKSNRQHLEIIIHAALNTPFETSDILLSIEDVSEKNRAIRELKQNQNAISTISEHIPDLLLMTDLEGKIEYTSPACFWLGYTESEMLKNNLFDFVYPEDLPALMEFCPGYSK
jgi:PAS domain S-box-containing protein